VQLPPSRCNPYRLLKVCRRPPHTRRSPPTTETRPRCKINLIPSLSLPIPGQASLHAPQDQKKRPENRRKREVKGNVPHSRCDFPASRTAGCASGHSPPVWQPAITNLLVHTALKSIAAVMFPFAAPGRSTDPGPGGAAASPRRIPGRRPPPLPPRQLPRRSSFSGPYSPVSRQWRSRFHRG